MRVRRSSGPSLTAALLVASLGVAGVSLGAAGKDAPLADAAQRGDTAAVQTLIEHGADIGARSNSVVQYLFDKGATLDVVARDGRTRLRVADGVEYGNSFAAQPHTAELLRTLGATEIPCPAPCAAAIPEEALVRPLQAPR